MNNFDAIIYGFIQGLTEFLPVSSSGHLALLPHFLHIEDPGVLFDLAMHVGTALSVIVYFHKEIGILLEEAGSMLLRKDSPHQKRGFLINMVASTGATFILVMILKKLAFDYGRNPFLIEMNLVLFGLLMYGADRFALKSGKDGDVGQMNSLNMIKAVMIGLSQSIAIFPGVSRSGITLTMARFLHLSRREAGRYSFLLSLPIIIGGFIFQLPKFLIEKHPFDMASFAIGLGVSFLVGLLAIHLFLKLVERIGLIYFSFYRIVLAIVVFVFTQH